ASIPRSRTASGRCPCRSSAAGGLAHGSAVAPRASPQADDGSRPLLFLRRYQCRLHGVDDRIVCVEIIGGAVLCEDSDTGVLEELHARHLSFARYEVVLRRVEVGALVAAEEHVDLQRDSREQPLGVGHHFTVTDGFDWSMKRSSSIGAMYSRIAL